MDLKIRDVFAVPELIYIQVEFVVNPSVTFEGTSQNVSLYGLSI